MTELTYQRPSVWVLFKRALSGNAQHDFTKGSIGVAAFLLAVPMVLEMAMESIFAIVDIFFVASLGFEAVTVVGLTEAVLTILYAIAIGLSMGVTALVARRIGENDPDKADLAAGQALWVGLIVALIHCRHWLVLCQRHTDVYGRRRCSTCNGDGLHHDYVVWLRYHFVSVFDQRHLPWCG